MTNELRMVLLSSCATVLASIALYPLYVDASWFWSAAGAVAAVAVANLAARQLPVPQGLVPLVGLAGLTCYLTARYAGTEALLGFLPGPAALEDLREVASRGFTDVHRYAAPAPAFPGLTLLAVGGVGLVAVMVDLLAVRLRKAVLAGVPLLAIFAVTSAIRLEGAGWLPFAFTAAGFTVLLMAEARERVIRWGRPVIVGSRESGQVGLNAFSSAARRIGFTALIVAVVVPVAIPGMNNRAIFDVGRVGFGDGIGPSIISTPNPIVSIKRDLTLPTTQVVLRYQTDDPSPQYLRMYALDKFDGVTWSMSSLEGKREQRIEGQDLPRPAGLGQVESREVTTQVTISQQIRDLHFLPMPYPPRRVITAGDWRYDPETLMVFSSRDVADGRDFEVQSLHLFPSPKALNNVTGVPQPIWEKYGDVPKQVPAAVHELARRVTRDADTPYHRAVALQEWFTDPTKFTYSLQRKTGNSTSALADFLLRDREGYCEQFAASMALMARMLGIPARVAVGYTAGSEVGENQWEVTTQDAHAWPELFFQGVGWVRFEPTPSSTAGQATATTPSYAEPFVALPPTRPTTSPVPEGGGPSAIQPGQPTTPPSTTPFGSELQGAPPTGATPTKDKPNELFPTGGLVFGLSLAFLVALPWLTRLTVRRLRWARAHGAAGQAHAAWNELRDVVLDLRLPWRASDTPRAAVRRLRTRVALSDAAAELLYRIVRAEEQARYAPEPAPLSDLASDSRTVRRALASAMPRWRRCVAWLIPISLFHTLRRIVALGADALDGVDEAIGTTTTRLRRRSARRSTPAT